MNSHTESESAFDYLARSTETGQGASPGRGRGSPRDIHAGRTACHGRSGVRSTLMRNSFRSAGKTLTVSRNGLALVSLAVRNVWKTGTLPLAGRPKNVTSFAAGARAGGRAAEGA